MPQRVPNEVRRMRRDKDMTQARLAALVGISRQTLIAIEKGGGVGLANAMRLARRLEMPIEELFPVHAAADNDKGGKGMHKDMNGLDRIDIDRTRDRYFITDTDGVERETDMAGYIDLERRCGFRPKPGCGPFATGSFGSGGRSGHIAMWFDGPAKVLDNDTGEEEPAADFTAAVDRAHELNKAAKRQRYFAMRA